MTMVRPASGALLALLTLAACGETAADPDAAATTPTIVQPAIGSQEVLREKISAAPGHELIVADLVLPPNAVGDAHSHPWEEYLYVLGGSAVLDVEGAETRTVEAGSSATIPAKTVHTPRAGPEGIRAIIMRVHKDGDPLSIPAGQGAAGEGA